ncbi:MAG: hypothetical protein V4592_24115 [Bacteroidota bacterium]
MKKLAYLLSFLIITLLSCKKIKNQDDQQQTCDIQKTKSINNGKVTIVNGVWGTVSIRQGDCMPMSPPATNTCTECAIQREVRIYAYTKSTDATPAIPVTGLYDSFSTQLIKTVTTDSQGFFEITLPDGKYTIVFVEGGKLYASIGDGQGGISPVTVAQNKVNFNLLLNRAVD